MDFLGIGPLEILLILILAFILLGPGKIPEVARTLGRTIRAVRKASADLSAAVTKELEATRNKPSPTQPEEAKTVEAPLATNNQPSPAKLTRPPNREGH